MSDMIGQRIGPYEIVSLLGKGGMAQVYRARQQLGGKVARDVALKLIDARLSMSEEFIARFEREAQTLVSLSHPHILKAFDYGQYNETVYLVMELLPGGSLAQLIRKELLPLPDVSKWLDQIGQALDYAHRQGIVHRDMKPQNVLLDNEGNAFLTDFGIVKLLGETSSLTQSNTSIGTPAYMAPEQWTSGRVDARTDLYAFGVMLFEMIGGHVPFTGDTPFRVMYLHTNEPPPSIYNLRPDLPVSLDRVITKALAKDPMARYESANAMVSDFRAAMVGAAVNAPVIAVAPSNPKPMDTPASISGPIPNNKTVVLPTSKPGLPVAPSATGQQPQPQTQPQIGSQTQPQIANSDVVKPTGASKLPIIIGLVVAAVIAVVAGGVIATVLMSSKNPPTSTTVVENTISPIAPATLLVAALPTTQAATQSVPAAVTTTAPTLTTTNTATSATTSTNTATVRATDTSIASDTSVPTTAAPTLVPELTATVLDSAVILQTALSQALTQTATVWTPTLTQTSTPTLTFTPSLTSTITPSETPTLTATQTLTATVTQTFTPTDDLISTAVGLAQLTNTAVMKIAMIDTQNAMPTATYTPSLTYTPSPVPTSTATNSPTPKPTNTPSNTPLPTKTKTPLPTKTNTLIPTDTLTPSNTPIPTDTPVPTDTPEPSNTPTPTSTNTPRPSITPIPTKTYTPSPTVPGTRIPLDVLAATVTARAGGTPGAGATDTPFYNGDLLLPNTMNVSFSEEFYDNSNNWPLYSKPNVGTVQIADNQLQFAIKPNAYMEVLAPASAPSVTDFYFRTQVSYTAPTVWADTSFGVIMHRSAAGYDFIDIRPGVCLFALNTYTAKTKAYQALNFKNACLTGTLLKNATSFVLTIVGSNNQFTVYIDNTKEVTLADTAKLYTTGAMGVYGLASQSNGFNVSFTNIAIGQ